ncbi:MAG: 50S ribosomal protein L30 [Armatimonadota bacterium]
MPKRKRQLKITLRRSPIGYKYDQRHTVRCLGLSKLRQQVVHEDVPAIRGMLKKVSHLVDVEEAES